MVRFALIVISLIGSAAEPAYSLTLAENGEPAAVIVLGRHPDPVAFEAAQELQRVIRRISGATLPIYLENEWHGGSEGPRRNTNRIFVGDSQIARDAGLDVSELPPEGFVIKTTMFAPTRASPEGYYSPPTNRFRVLILAGRDDPKQNHQWRGDRSTRYLRGTAYAVYAFLEEDLGVRWLWPGEEGEVVPRMKTIVVEPNDRTDAPKLPKRNFRNNTGYWTGHIWQARGKVGTPLPVWTRLAYESDRWLDHLRMGDSTDLYSSGEGRGGRWIDKYAQDHPEWFALQPNGKRLATSAHGRVRLCLSNPQVIEQIASDAGAFFDNNPTRHLFGIELSDVYGSYCVCMNCKAWGPTLSDLVARHWSAIGEKVVQTHPDKLLYAHPYHKYIDPPQTVKKIANNIVLFPVGKNSSGYTQEEDRQRSIESWLGWSKLNEQLMVWRPNYPSNDGGLPINYARLLGEDIKLFYENKMIGVDVDHMRRIWSGGGLNYYVACKLFWDPEADVDQIINDYCEKGFGPAHQHVRGYWDDVQRVTRQIAAYKRTGEYPRGLSIRAIHFTPPITGALHKRLDDARDAARGDGAIQDRIEFLRRAVAFAEVEYKFYMAGLRADREDLSESDLEHINEIRAERKAYLRAAIGQWHVEPEVLWSADEWIERILLEKQLRPQPESETTDELPEQYEAVMQLPEKWKFKLDPDLVGDKQRWFADDHDDSEWKEIRVGEYWEKQGYPDFDGMAWYRLRVNLPSKLSGKQTELWFGGADETAKVYVNGKVAGDYDFGPQGWWTPPERRQKPFVIDVTPQIKPGRENLIAVRVIDTNKVGGLWKPVKVVIRH